MKRFSPNLKPSDFSRRMTHSLPYGDIKELCFAPEGEGFQPSPKGILKNDQGMALVIAIMVMVILISVTGAGLRFSGLDLKTTANLKSKGLAFYTTEAGLTHAWVELENSDGINDFAAVVPRQRG